MNTSYTPDILVVDDTPENIGILFEFLSQRGFSVAVAEDGESALQIATNEAPSLILLDVMMPGIDGFETCRRLKQDQRTRDVPVIFMTALADTVNKVKGFKIGAVDYITKPFEHEEVLVRINTHLTLQRLQNELRAQNDQLRALDQEKSEFLSMAAHDMKNPLGNIVGLIELIKMQPSGSTELMQYLEMIDQSTRQMLELIMTLLDVNRIESGRTPVTLEHCDLNTLTKQMLFQYEQRARAKQLNIRFEGGEGDCRAQTDSQLYLQVLDNLISNAIKYSPPGKNIHIRVSPRNVYVRCEVMDEGPGLSERDRERLFSKFARLSARPTANESSTGLGLFIVKKLVDLMHGQVWCESEPGQGANFIVEMPV